jgi:hypothetical protein
MTREQKLEAVLREVRDDIAGNVAGLEYLTTIADDEKQRAAYRNQIALLRTRWARIDWALQTPSG